MPELDAYAAALLRVVDDVATGCAIFTCAGQPIASSPGLSRTLADDADADRVLAESMAMARVLGAAEPDPKNDAPGAASTNRAIDTLAGRYDLTAFVIPQPSFDGDRSIVVTVKFALAPTVARDLAAAFRLTPREVEIAHLIAEGDSNQRIADRLQLSVRTVHHHTERVLRKLGVRGRAAVASHVYRK